MNVRLRFLAILLSVETENITIVHIECVEAVSMETGFERS